MIRKCKKTELSSIMQIWLDGNIEAHPFIPTDYWQRNLEQVRHTLMSAEIYVYEDNHNKVIGFIGLLEHFIEGLFVHTPYRASGVGQELIEYVKMNQPFLVLHVYQKNSAAIDFYQKEGFSITKEEMNHNTNEKIYEMTWER